MEEYETLFWEVMENATGVGYEYSPTDKPTVFDHTQCAEAGSQNFWSGHPWDAQARKYIAQLITSSGLANVTAKDVLVASTMEARGFLSAVYNYNAANTDTAVPHTIIRGASNHDSQTVARDPADPSVWVPV